MKFAAQLAHMTARIRTAVADAGEVVRKSMNGLSHDLRKVADHLVTIDVQNGRAISRANSDMPLLAGSSTGLGLPHVFRADQVHSLPILDPHGSVIGTHFPSQLRDSQKPMSFTHDGLESVRNYYYQYRKTGRRRKPKWSYERTSPAPWGKDTVFAMAHGYGEGYGVQVKKRIPFTKWSRLVPTLVDGETYGLILAANKHFKQAVRGEPTAELIQMSCSPAAGSAARTSAESLRSVGIGLDVWATEKTYLYNESSAEPMQGFLKKDGEIIVGHGSETEFDESDNSAKSPWRKYSASDRQPDTGG